MPNLIWRERNAWIAVFDILGFANLAARADDDFARSLLFGKLEDLLSVLDDPLIRQHAKLDVRVISDTIILFAPDVQPQSYPWLMQLSKALIEKSITCRLPLRGAISIGKAFTSDSPPIFVGPAFIEAYRYCEDQDWVGLLLTPSSATALRAGGLEPSRHGFATGEIPMRNCPAEGVLAYRLQRDGATNFESPLLAPLQEMRQQASSAAIRAKYDRTIQFLTHNYQRLQTRNPKR